MTLSPNVCLLFFQCRIRSFTRFDKILLTRTDLVTLPQQRLKEHSTKIDFAESQLSLSLISLSPLIISHFNLLQQVRVRSSNILYYAFHLLMIRSLSFGSSTRYFYTINIYRFRFAYNLIN